jgi:phospholipid N-methyltransferase
MLSEQEIYQSILEKMLIQTEQKQINSSEDFIKKLTQELRSSNVINAKF